MFNTFEWIFKLRILVDGVTSFWYSFSSFSQFPFIPKMLLTHKLDSFKNCKIPRKSRFCVCKQSILKTLINMTLDFTLSSR